MRPVRVHGPGATGRVVLRWVFTLFLAAVGLASGLVLATRPAKAILASGHSEGTPKELELNQLSLRSVVYDRDGGVLAALHHDENRSPIPLASVPKHVINAVLDVEDDSFFQHDGVNVRSILRAAITNAESGSVRQGGSTITQQLVKQSLLTPEKNLERKVKEAVYAVRLEDQMTKEEILEAYLNTVYFGNGAYGVQAAAETYWGVQAKDLTVEQGAFLAGIIQNPSNYDPFRADRPEMRERATGRRDYALQRMVARKHLTQAEADALKQVPVPEGGRKNPNASRDDYFVEEVKQALLDDPQYNLGPTYQDRFNAIFRGGLRVETTFDPRLQQAAQDAVNKQIPNTNGRFVGALASIEPSTGAVRAMVSNLNFNDAKYNLVTGRGADTGRQPGSSFKTIVLLAALEEGISPNDTINGSEPCPVRIEGVEPNPYEPGNYEGSKGGTMPLHKATANSLNCAYIRLGLSLDDNPFKSMDKVAAMARRMGISIPDDGKYGPSIALGAKEATPLEMASAYATIANDGVRQAPYFVQRVLDRQGKVVYERKSDGERVIDANIARAATWTLRKVVESGTGTRARLGNRQVAGKTGTSQEWRDAWFVGYTPQLATAVWMGNPNKQDEMKNVGGIRVTGGSYPARTWNAFMTEALKGQPMLKFTEPNLDAFGKPTTLQAPKTVTGGKATTTTTKKKPKPKATTTTVAATEGGGDSDSTDGGTTDSGGGTPGGGNGGDG